MFKQAPVYNDALKSENQIINLDNIERVFPNPNVPVDPGAVDTVSCQVQFASGASVIVLIDYASLFTQIQTLTGEIDQLGTTT